MDSFDLVEVLGMGIRKGFSYGNLIHALTGQRMTAEDSPGTKERSPDRTPGAKRLNGVLGAGGEVAAGRFEEGRKGLLIDPNEAHQDLRERL